MSIVQNSTMAQRESETAGDAVPCGSKCQSYSRQRLPHGRMLDINESDLQCSFAYPIEEAARRLGVGLTALKGHCRSLGIGRWPFRKVHRCKMLANKLLAGVGSRVDLMNLQLHLEELQLDALSPLWSATLGVDMVKAMGSVTQPSEPLPSLAGHPAMPVSSHSAAYTHEPYDSCTYGSRPHPLYPHTREESLSGPLRWSAAASLSQLPISYRPWHQGAAAPHTGACLSVKAAASALRLLNEFAAPHTGPTGSLRGGLSELTATAGGVAGTSLTRWGFNKPPTSPVAVPSHRNTLIETASNDSVTSKGKQLPAASPVAPWLAQSEVVSEALLAACQRFQQSAPLRCPQPAQSGRNTPSQPSPSHVHRGRVSELSKGRLSDEQLRKCLEAMGVC